MAVRKRTLREIIWGYWLGLYKEDVITHNSNSEFIGIRELVKSIVVNITVQG